MSATRTLGAKAEWPIRVDGGHSWGGGSDREATCSIIIVGELLSARQRLRVGLLLQILRMPQQCPPKAELAEIAEHIVAGGHRAVLDPGDQIVEGSLGHCAIDAAMPGPANGALDQQTSIRSRRCGRKRLRSDDAG